SPGIGQDVSSTRTRAGSGTGRCGRVTADLDFAVQQLVRRRRRHDEEDVILSRTADLKTGTGATDAVHGGRRPLALEVSPLAASHRTTASGSANANGELLHAGQNNDAISFLYCAEWNILAADHCL